MPEPGLLSFVVSRLGYGETVRDECPVEAFESMPFLPCVFAYERDEGDLAWLLPGFLIPLHLVDALFRY